MRVVLFTSAEPLYLPRYLRPILDAHASAIDRVVVAPFDAPLPEELRAQFGAYGARAGARMAARYTRSRLLDALPWRLGRRLTGRHHSVRSVAAAHGVPVERAPDVADPRFVERIRDCDPDQLVSVVAGPRLPPELLDSATDALNLHGSLLPRYRGRATAFWPLFYGDDRTGVTAHRMTERFDAGPIVAQRSFPLDPADTVDSVYRKLAATGSELAVDLLERYPDLPADRPNETGTTEYHGLPGPDERRRFLQAGNAFF